VVREPARGELLLVAPAEVVDIAGQIQFQRWDELRALEPALKEVLVADRQGGEGLVLASPYQAKNLQAQAGQPKNRVDHPPYQGMAYSQLPILAVFPSKH
jgi:hypothetical protein